MRRILALCAITLLAVLGLTACGASSQPSAAPAGSASASASPSRSATVKPGVPTRSATNTAVPQRVSDTLAKIDAGDWPPQDGSGTQGGRTFGNFEKRLPATGADGTKVRYTEWDVNIKKPNRGRDAERIVTGSDGSAWYTLDHYETFTRIR
ncbi:Guanine-specific ribonuclease N1 and T1 OS=Tsukamurella paurometabola (strain ATCC 8368 / DSM/ CCUG 35730 / CIP 100753 / JCM 10117 / KCTC 9821 / NBRC 16120/ NCIMB 702349 / NCTC 13040) OX=521096 GN=Tpau_0946 PE=3 SV=1 [Tsukamurella paurometabola]|uniref:Guanine-specific ribonuclease N1 and T1 n=1 Tax=Tsukamurella paurometabola (strain ATCC 8368 / DSM 20162 / CCUG 35730 / CIP 100753 / JCM 10117 / KCTC 9821 / NBRC 16120 / NCIMB 702349 / NCTC 13040) TaxID=521096 RepID=D5UUK8_TSUPD|nr:ribonuclease domain-containing protein [Tsukamurella paurometabola]ADG77579.1 guanine-specific ribonuclease N1 and T1 [Tsukamurella paurometabola DSM 20162]SUP27792.1 ribonuclease [Tsukamurella paurometabola]